MNTKDVLFNNTRRVRIPVQIPNAGQFVEVPYGGTFYAIIKATGNVQAKIGDDPAALAPPGLVVYAEDGLVIGKNSRNLYVTSDFAGDTITVDIGFGKEIPLDLLIIANQPVAVGKTTVASGGGAINFVVPGDKPWLILDLVNTANPPFQYDVQWLDQAGEPMANGGTHNPVNPQPCYYFPDGTYAGEPGQGAVMIPPTLNEMPSHTFQNGKTTICIPTLGAATIQLIIVPESGGATGYVTGQFSNSGPQIGPHSQRPFVQTHNIPSLTDSALHTVDVIAPQGAKGAIFWMGATMDPGAALKLYQRAKDPISGRAPNNSYQLIALPAAAGTYMDSGLILPGTAASVNAGSSGINVNTALPRRFELSVQDVNASPATPDTNITVNIEWLF